MTTKKNKNKHKYTHKHKHKHKHKKRQTHKQTGGVLLGKGLSGEVYYPALQCKNKDETPTGNYVSKVSSIKSAEKEFEKTSILRENKDELDFAIFPEYMCEYNKTHNLLFSKMGGYSLIQYHNYLENIGYEKNAKKKNIEKETFDNKYFEEIIDSLKELKQNIKILNGLGIYQGDISFDNILYNQEEKKAYLIDFERKGNEEDESLLIQDLINDLEKFKKKID